MYIKFALFVVILLKLCTSQISLDPNGVEIAGDFFKCKCKQNEALIDGSCQSSIDPLIIGWDVWTERVILINVTQFNVSVREPTCPDGKSKVQIDLTNVLIYPNGSLFNKIWYEEPLTDNYCVEFKPGHSNTIGSAELCRLDRTVPLCCEVDQIRDENGVCLNSQFQFNPSNYEDVDWTEYSNYKRTIQCPEGSILRKEILSEPYGYYGAVLDGYPVGGLLRWLTIYMAEPLYLSSEEYCVSVSKVNDSSMSYVAHFCISDAELTYETECLDVACVRKCCPSGYIFDNHQRSCVESSYQVAFAFKEEASLPNNISILYGLPCEEFYVEDIASENGTALLTENGLPIGINATFPTDARACIDGLTGNAQHGKSAIVIRALVCFPAKVEPKCHLRWILGSVILGISCIFYLATIIVYVCIEDLRRTIGGKCLVSEVSALLVAYLVLIYLQNFQTYKGIGCHITGSIEHIAVLAAFFWLNILCYDMWSTLKSVCQVDVRLAPSKKFIKYCIYGWGLPILIVAIRLIIDHLLEQFDHPLLIRSEIGEAKCFFSNDNPTAKWAYLYLPVLLLLVVNFVFFIHVAIIILKANRDRKRYTQSHSRSSMGRNNLTANMDKTKLYLKLFIVMGMTWILEVVTWVVVPADSCYLWLLDIVNMFQGVFIFIIFVCKKSVLEKIMDRFLPSRKYSPNKHSRSTEEIEISSKAYEKSKTQEDICENTALKPTN